jgi:hypothetical protein
MSDQRPTPADVNKPSEKKYFIKLFLVAESPFAGQDPLILVFHQSPQFVSTKKSELYCSKVTPGQTLHEVMKKEIHSINPETRFQIVNITDDGFDEDRQGNTLPRYGIHTIVTYFDSNGKTLQGMHMSWVGIADFMDMK